MYQHNPEVVIAKIMFFIAATVMLCLGKVRAEEVKLVKAQAPAVSFQTL